MSVPTVPPPGYSPAQDLLAGRVILVTGASRGIGRECALALAGHGAEVVLLGRDVRRLESAYDAIVASGGPEPAIYPMDLAGATPDDHADLARRLEEAYGRLDGLVHNAAALGGLTPIEHLEPLEWARVLQVNLNAPFLMTRCCLPQLRAAPDPVVVFVTDSQGARAPAYWGAYAVSKSAIDMLAGTLAAELETEPPVRVSWFDPGPVRTDLRRAAYPTEPESRIAAPSDVAPAFVYLLGPDSCALGGLRTAFSGSEADP